MAITRRKFLKTSAFAGMGTAIGTGTLLSAPSLLTRPRVAAVTGQGELHFEPVYVQRGRGPHLLEWGYATDRRWDAFHSNISVRRDGVRISDVEGRDKFGITVRWNVEGFGYTFITADNGGELYELPEAGKTATFNLNVELAGSRVARNSVRVKKFMAEGWMPSAEARQRIALSEEYLADARKRLSDSAKAGALAQTSLFHAMWASEIIEMEKAKFEIIRRGRRHDFYIGCNARAACQMDDALFFQRFLQLFDFATLTFVWKDPSPMGDFEREEGKTNYDMRDLMFDRLRRNGLPVEGRAVTWFHKWVTPDFLKEKSYDDLRKYVERHTREMIHHYGNEMYGWELVNEFHDWANEVQLNPEQIVELTRLACDVAKDAAPGLQRIVNNCCPFAEYVQMKEWSGQPARYPQRTPWQFTRDLVEAKVDFTLIGQQMYFPYHDLQDFVVYLERFQEFGKAMHVSEAGAPGGPSNESVLSGRVRMPTEPYAWHRPWDEELQADWVESTFTLAYSLPFVGASVWHDFVDTDAYIDNGGFVRSFQGETKASFDRLAGLERRWKSLPPESRRMEKR